MIICRQVILSQIILLNHPTCQKEQLRPHPPDLKHAPSHHLRFTPPGNLSHPKVKQLLVFIFKLVSVASVFCFLFLFFLIFD